jgi:photosystem II stability/assembly factor-like uncharacterized protein
MTYRSMNNSYGVIQFVGGAVSDDGDWIVGGSQDNGTFFLGDRGAPDTWLQIQGGDGGHSLIDSANGVIIASYPRFEFTRWDGTAWSPASQGISDRGLFYPPLEADPNNGASIWTGGGSVWRSLDHGRTWAKVSPLLPAAVSAIAVAASDPNVVYVGTANGYVYRTTDALATSPTWTDTDPAIALPGGTISSIAIDPADPNTVLVSYALFDGMQIWKTTAGVTGWRNLDATLPDVPVNAIAINPRNTSMVYAGTDMGVFESLDSGETWRVANENLASTIVSRLVFRGDSSELYVFTHGRGAYVVNVGDRSPPTHDERDNAVPVELAPDFEHRADIRAATPAASDPELSCGFADVPQQTRSVWYVLSGAAAGRYAVTTTGSAYDTVVAVFAAGGSPGAALREIDCNDDTDRPGGVSALTFTAAAGTTYYVEVTRSADAAPDSVGNSLVLHVRPAGN